MREFLIYGCIGVANTLIHYVIFMALLHCVSMQSVSNVGAFLVAVTFSFHMNARFTFKKRPTTSRYLKMVGAMTVVSFLCGLTGDIFGIPPLLTFVCYCAISYVAGFLLTKFFVFGGSGAEGEAHAPQPPTNAGKA